MSQGMARAARSPAEHRTLDPNRGVAVAKAGTRLERSAAARRRKGVDQVSMAKVVEGFARRARSARAAVFRGIPVLLCFTMPASAQPSPAALPGEPPAAAPATAASAAPATADGGQDVAQHFARVLAQPGGLTSAEAARRAAETSVQAEIERQDTRIAANSQKEVVWGSMPRLELTGRTTRLSRVRGFFFTDPVTGMDQE